MCAHVFGIVIQQMLIEYCNGGALDSIMVELEKPLTELQIAYVCKHMTNGLHFLHKNKVIHRDLKAGNVLLTMEGGVKLGTFYSYFFFTTISHVFSFIFVFS